METICAAKMRLLDKYVDATSELFEATAKLRRSTGVGFQKALAASEAARAKCSAARRALLSHRDLHGC